MALRYAAMEDLHLITSKSVVTGASDADFVNDVDTRNYRGVLVVTRIANLTSGSLAFTGTNDMEIKLQHSDTTTASDYADVGDNDVEGDATGEQLQRQSAALAAAAEVVKQSWYMAGKRYIRIGLERGSSSTPATATYTVEVWGLRGRIYT